MSDTERDERMEPVAFDLMVMLDVPGREVWDVEDTVRSREEADEWLRGAPDREHYRIAPLYSGPQIRAAIEEVRDRYNTGPEEAGWSGIVLDDLAARLGLEGERG